MPVSRSSSLRVVTSYFPGWLTLLLAGWASHALAAPVVTGSSATAHPRLRAIGSTALKPQAANSDLVVNNNTAQPNPGSSTQNVGSPYTISYDQTWSNVYVGYGGGAGMVTHSSNNLTAGTVYVGDVTGGTGDYELSNTGTLVAGGALVGNNGGTGTFNQSGGSFNTYGEQLFLGNGKGSQGTYTLSGSNSTLAMGTVFVSNNGGTGTFNQQGGSFTVTPYEDSGGAYYGQGVLSVGGSTGSQGTFNLSGGTLTTFDEIDDGEIYDPPDLEVGIGGTGTFNQTGGNYVGDHAISLGGDGGTGTYTLSGASTAGTGALLIGSGGTGVFNLDGGTFTTQEITNFSSKSGTSTFHFNGGTLQPIFSLTSPPLIGGITTGDVRNGGAIINTQGFSVVITQNLVHSTVSGDNASDGGLSKQGAGTLTLASTNNTYTGATVVYGGTLVVSGSLTTSPLVSVASGATLAITGSVSTGYLINSGRLRLEGSLTIPAGGTFSNSGTLDVINYSGSLPASLNNGSAGQVLRASDVHITQISRTSSSGTVQVTVGAYAGHTYQLQASAALDSTANWTSVGDSQTPTADGSLVFSDTPSSGAGSARFYRVLISP